MSRIVLSDLETQIDAHVGTTLLLHARGLNAAGRVVIDDPCDGELPVRVGTHKATETVTFLTEGGVLTEPECTCPGLVRPFCVHVAAAVLAVDAAGLPVVVDDVAPGTSGAAGASGGPGGVGGASGGMQGGAGRRGNQAWRRELDAALESPSDVFALAPAAPAVTAKGRGKPPHPETGRLALAVEWSQPAFRDRRESPSVTLRPLLRSHTGAWVKSGAGWHEIGYQDQPWQAKVEVTPLRRRQVALFGDLLALHRGSGHGYYSRYDEHVTFDDFASPLVWRVIADLHAAGVALIQPGKPPGEVALHDAVRLELVLDRDGDDLALEPRLVAADGAPLDHAVMLLLGRTPHGVAWFAGNDSTAVDAPGDDRGPRAVLHLAPLDPATLDAAATLTRVPLVRVPAEDEAAFVADYLPTLAERYGVVVADPSIRLPEIGEPRLEAAVRMLPEHRAEIDWTWVYTVGETTRRLAPDDPAAWRRRDDEDAILTRLAATLEKDFPFELVSAMPGARVVTASDGGERRIALRPMDLYGIHTAVFATSVLPAWRADPGIDVVVDDTSGTDPQRYRFVEGAPTVKFAAKEGQDRDWFDLGVTVTVPAGGAVGVHGRDEQVPFAPLFTALARGETRMLLPTGTVVDLTSPALAQLAELIAESRDLHDTRGPVVRLSRLQGGLFEELEALGVLDAQAEAWRRSVRALTAPSDAAPLSVPAGVTATLRDYQRSGLDWLVRLHALGLGGVLADDMGLGKTLQVLALVAHVRERDAGAPPFLVVAPASVTHGWAREAAALTPGLRVAVVSKTAAKRGVPLAELARGADVVVTSYTLFRLDADEYEAADWSGLVLDEAQFAKNHTSHAYRGAKTLRAPFKLAVTGTPMENHLGELWSLLSITAPGLFPRRDRFTEFYRYPIERAADQRRLALLRRRIGPLMLRRTKADVLAELPDKQEQIVEVELNAGHRRAYQTLLNRERRKILGLLDDLDDHRIEVLRSLTLLRQAAIDPSLVDDANAKVPSTKLDAVAELLDDAIAEGHRVLVFSQFTRFLGKVRERLAAAGVDCCYLDGRTRNRADVIESFRAGAAPVFLISLKAGGFGLNLTEADYCVVLDPWWNPAAELQAVDRAHRIGQTRKVMVYRLVAKDTIEEKVMALQAEKSALFAGVTGGAEFAAPQLDAAAIRGLLAG